MKAAKSTKRKDKMKDYKLKGIREIHKARDFEKWIKKFVKQAKKGKIRTYIKDGSGKKVKSTTDKWTFGPLGVMIDGKFSERIPTWAERVIDKYSEYYKKEHVPKQKMNASTRETIEEVRKVGQSRSMHKEALAFKKRAGVGPTRQK